MKIALAQINPVAGDLKGNALKITESITKARNAGCDLVVFPELSLTGAPLQGLTRVRDFIFDCQEELDGIVRHTDGIGVLIGTIVQDECQDLCNAAILIENRRIAGYTAKKIDRLVYPLDECCNIESYPETGEFDFRGERLTIVIGKISTMNYITNHPGL